MNWSSSIIIYSPKIFWICKNQLGIKMGCLYIRNLKELWIHSSHLNLVHSFKISVYIEKMRPSFVVLIFALTVLIKSVRFCNGGELKLKYYRKSCPAAEFISQAITWDKVDANPSLAAKLLRLHYHDCFVRVWFVFPLINAYLIYQIRDLFASSWNYLIVSENSN